MEQMEQTKIKQLFEIDATLIFTPPAPSLEGVIP